MKTSWMKEYLLPEGKKRMTEEAYRMYAGLISHERYISKRARRHEVLFSDMEAASQAAGISTCHTGGCEAVLRSIEITEMMSCVQKLGRQEKLLVEELFFKNEDMSGREIAEKLGIPRTALQYRKEKILKKLKNMMES